MMHGREKSDPAIVALKPPNVAGQPAAEAVERRAGAARNADQQRTLRTQSRVSVAPGLDRIRHVAVTHARWEAYAGKPHVQFCAGGGQQCPSLPRLFRHLLSVLRMPLEWGAPAGHHHRS